MYYIRHEAEGLNTENFNTDFLPSVLHSISNNLRQIQQKHIEVFDRFYLFSYPARP